MSWPLDYIRPTINYCIPIIHSHADHVDRCYVLNQSYHVVLNACYNDYHMINGVYSSKL